MSSLVDEGLIEAAAETPAKKRPVWRRYAAAAACLMVLCGAGVVYLITGGFRGYGASAGGSGINNAGGAADAVTFMSYAGPVLPLTTAEENPGVTAERRTDWDFNQLFQDSPKNLLSIYFCAGCPTLDGTADVIRALERNGVSMIEIGIPFSDPMADGIVIQNAATRALHNGMSLRLLFEQLRDIRRDVRIPLILMGYLNPIMQFGFEAFCQKCVECGIDGVIIPDLPFRDYEESYKAIASKYDIRVIMLITPETSEARVREIDAHTDGFIYLVSSAATTGAQKDFDTRKQAYFKKIEDMNLRNPRMVGFGISNKQTFDAACAHSSGAIIGSRFVTLLNEKEGDAEKAIRQLKEDLKQ